MDKTKKAALPGGQNLLATVRTVMPPPDRPQAISRRVRLETFVEQSGMALRALAFELSEIRRGRRNNQGVPLDR